MLIEYDPNLMEQSVFLAARQDRTLERELHAAIDPLYLTADRRDKTKEFSETYRRFFLRLKLNAALDELLAERPEIFIPIGRCMVREAARVKDESAELLVKKTDAATTPAQRTLMVQVYPRSLIEPAGLIDRLRRDLYHVADMLDARFGYKPRAIKGLAPRQNLVRDRYHILWNVYIEGRLHREDKSSEKITRGLEMMFARVLGDELGPEAPQAYQRLFGAAELGHGQLFSWASDPCRLLRDGGKEDGDRGPVPGKSCPLCGFPTYDWFEFSGDQAAAATRSIGLAYVGWSPRQGACRQCAELFIANATAVT